MFALQSPLRAKQPTGENRMNLTRSTRYHKGRSGVITLLLSALFSFFVLAGYITSHAFEVAFPLPLYGLAFFPLTAFFFVVLLSLWKILDSLQYKKRTEFAFFAFIKRHCNSIAFFVFVQAFIFVCWTPVWLAAWPGFYCYDMEALSQFAGGTFNVNHPLLYTIFASTIVFGIGTLFNDINTGVAVLVGIFALLTSATFAFSLRFIAKNGSYGVFIFGILYYALDPIVVMFSLCTTKDVLSCAFLVQLFIMVLCIIKTPLLLNQNRICIALVLLVYLLCSTRNNTIIALIISLPFITYYLQKNRRILVICYSIGVVCFLIWTGPISSLILSSYDRTPVNHFLLHINSLPTQQLTNAWHDPDITKEDRELLINMIGEDSVIGLNNYKPESADNSRGAFATTLIQDNNLKSFYKVYFIIGLHNPDAYFRAFLSMTYEAWYPFATPQGYNNAGNNSYLYDQTATSLFACFVEPPATHDSQFPTLFDKLWEISRYNVLQSNPLTSWLISIPFCLWLLLVTFARSLIKRNTSIKAACILLFAVTLSYLLGPMVLPRYYLYLFYLVPLLMFCLTKASESASQKATDPLD